MANITFANKNDGDPLTSDDVNEIKSTVNSKEDAPVVKAYNATLTFDENFRVVHTQVGDIDFLLAGSGNVDGVKGKVILTGDGANNLTFNATDFVNVGAGVFDNTKINIIDLQFENGKVYYEIRNG